MGNIYVNTSSTTRVDWVDWLCTQMVTEGWTRNNIYTAAPATTYNGQCIYRVLMEPSDAGQYAGGGILDIRVGRNGSGGDQIWLSVYTGVKNNKIYDNATDGLVATKGSGEILFDLVGHGFTTADPIAFGGGAEILYQNPQGMTPQNINTDDFKVGFLTSGTAAAATDVKMWSPRNGAGNLTQSSSAAKVINWPEGVAPTTYVWIDGYTIAGFMERAAGFQPFWAGHFGRESTVPDTQFDTWKTTEAIAGTGSQTVTIDRTLVSMQVGASVEVWYAGEKIEDVTITGIGTGPNTVTAVFGTATPSGAIMGKDPLPLGVWGAATSTVADMNLTDVTVQHCHGQNGERTVSHIDQQNADLAGTIQNLVLTDFSNVDPQTDATIGTGAIFGERLTGSHVSRRRMRGFISLPTASGVADYDRPTTGVIGASGTKYYKASASITTGDNCCLAIGPTEAVIA